MLFHPTNVPFKVFSILFKPHSVCCELATTKGMPQNIYIDIYEVVYCGLGGYPRLSTSLPICSLQRSTSLVGPYYDKGSLNFAISFVVLPVQCHMNIFEHGPDISVMTLCF